ncbi:DegT/DnrJ/EryC1/StrS family aminotransferase [candidate division WOR-3 bacterium]|nr:DegT/DnrJ/EryC1/StrS family aminotransferase [candidate division WOR-3 bacterium]
MIPIAKPIIGNDEIQAVVQVLKSGMLTQGKAVEEFENAFAEYIGVKNAIAVSNGTISLDIALKSLDIKQGDEVIVPSFTFISTANAVLFQGAKPVFVDVDERTFNINPEDVVKKITDKTKAIIGVHLFGYPFDVKAIQEICEDYNLYLVEDCAQAHGAEYKGKKVGGFGVAGCFSFYATKNMTTGEGGIITTDSDEIAKMCRLLRSHGENKKYYHTILGYNYRMTDIQAAIGVIQLKKLDIFNRKRINNAQYFNKHIKTHGLKLPHKESVVKHVFHQYAVTIEKEFPMLRDEFMEYLKKKSIGCAIHYPLPIHKQPLYRRMGYTDENVQCPVATSLSKKILSLPVHPSLAEKDLIYITETIK